MKLHFMAHSEDEIHHFILFEPEVVTYTLKKNVFHFLPTSLFSPSGRASSQLSWFSSHWFTVMLSLYLLLLLIVSAINSSAFQHFWNRAKR